MTRIRFYLDISNGIVSKYIKFIRTNDTHPNDTHGVNKDNGDYVTTNTWDLLFNQINLDSRENVKIFESMTN